MIPELMLDYSEIRRLLTAFIRDRIHGAGLRKAVLGLSGGVDSAVVAYLCAEALGAEQVHCLMLPYGPDGAASLTDARLVAETLGVMSEIVDIRPMADAVIATDSGMNRVRRGNIMARSRMILLYDRSAAHGALVVGTGNKTEILLGYSTVHGDSACAINPLGDLYKTQVWALAAELGVPARIIEKKPSADLWPGQTDEDDLGFTYAEADTLLCRLFDMQKTAAELSADGYDQKLIAAVLDRVERYSFKRMPPEIARVSG